MTDKLIFLFLIVFSSTTFAASAEVDVSVNGMVCGFCAQGISKKFSQNPNVEAVKVSLENKKVILKLKAEKELSDEAITNVLKEAGYSVSKIDRK
jgi:mercuric ion binding protein